MTQKQRVCLKQIWIVKCCVRGDSNLKCHFDQAGIAAHLALIKHRHWTEPDWSRLLEIYTHIKKCVEYCCLFVCMFESVEYKAG